MAIMIVRLMTDDDVVADIEEKENEILMKNPIRIAPTPQGIALVKLCPLSKDTIISVKRDKVLFVTHPEDELRNSYNSQFGGILLPETKLKLK